MGKKPKVTGVDIERELYPNKKDKVPEFDPSLPAYELIPKLDGARSLNTIIASTDVFRMGVYRDPDYLRLFLMAENVSKQVLQKDFGVVEGYFPNLKRFKYYSEFYREGDHDPVHPFQLLNIENIYAHLPPNSMFLVVGAKEPKIAKLIAEYVRTRQTGRSYSPIDILFNEILELKEKPIIAKVDTKELTEISKRAMEPIYLLRIILLANDKEILKLLSTVLLPSINQKGFYKVGKVKKPGNLLSPPKSPLWGIAREYFNATVSELYGVLKVPDPTVLSAKLFRGATLPSIVPQRPDGFRIGQIEDGREVRISIDDFKRHGYIIGLSGGGKTTLIELLVSKIFETGKGSVVLIDPHGDLADELASYYGDNENVYFFDPVEAPFGLNPVELPKMSDRNLAISLTIDQVLAIFSQILKLQETAVNVRYLLQVILRLLYSKKDNPTMGDIYRVIAGLYAGELDLDVDDPEFQTQVEILRSMQSQSFISALSRLEPFAKDKLIRKISSTTTVNLRELMRPGHLVIFRLSKGSIGEGKLPLIASTIILKLWFEALARARDREERTPVFVVIDEFQNVEGLPVLETILSEARKYGLHLILAHQHTKQVNENLLQSVLTNTAVKFIFPVSGADIEKLAKVDISFAESIKKAVTGLTTGRAVLKFVGRPKEPQYPPIVVQLDYPAYLFEKGAPWKRVLAIRRSKKFEPPEPEDTDLVAILNPVLKYIDIPRPLAQRILFEVFRKEGIHGKLGVNVPIQDILLALGVKRDKVEDEVAWLVSRGYLETEMVKNKKTLTYVRGLFNNIQAVASSSEGQVIGRKVILEYLSKGYYVTPAKQDPRLPAKPDLIAIPLDPAKNWRPVYSKAIAIEIESPNETQVHREQIVRNSMKESTRYFSEVHFWTSEEGWKGLTEAYEQFPVHAKKKVKLFKLKLSEGDYKLIQQLRENPKNSSLLDVPTSEEVVYEGDLPDAITLIEGASELEEEKKISEEEALENPEKVIPPMGELLRQLDEINADIILYKEGKLEIPPEELRKRVKVAWSISRYLTQKALANSGLYSESMLFPPNVTDGNEPALIEVFGHPQIKDEFTKEIVKKYIPKEDTTPEKPLKGTKKAEPTEEEVNPVKRASRLKNLIADELDVSELLQNYAPRLVESTKKKEEKPPEEGQEPQQPQQPPEEHAEETKTPEQTPERVEPPEMKDSTIKEETTPQVEEHEEAKTGEMKTETMPKEEEAVSPEVESQESTPTTPEPVTPETAPVSQPSETPETEKIGEKPSKEEEKTEEEPQEQSSGETFPTGKITNPEEIRRVLTFLGIEVVEATSTSNSTSKKALAGKKPIVIPARRKEYQINFFINIPPEYKRKLFKAFRSKDIQFIYSDNKVRVEIVSEGISFAVQKLEITKVPSS
jgi:DNA helicase HerA-like ATPase